MMIFLPDLQFLLKLYPREIYSVRLIMWWGSPQWQIEALRRFRIPDNLIEGYGYTQLTDEIKAKIFGLNAAKLWNIDVEARKKEITKDKITYLLSGTSC